MYYILNADQRNWFLAFKVQFQNTLSQKRVDVCPIKVSESSYAIPVACFSDPSLNEMKEALVSGGHLNAVTVRALTESESTYNRVL